MSKYLPLWESIGNHREKSFVMTYSEIEQILGFPIDHSFLSFKKELTEFGYDVKKISMKNETVCFERVDIDT